MYELAAFRQKHFLNVMVVSIWLIFFANLNDNGSARWFAWKHTSADLVWDWPQSPKRDLQEVLIFILCPKCICFAFHMCLCLHEGVFTVCSHHGFDRAQRRQRMRLCASRLCMYAFVCVRGKVLFFLRHTSFVKSLSSNLQLIRIGSSIAEHCLWIKAMNLFRWTCELYRVGRYWLLLALLIRRFCAVASW